MNTRICRGLAGKVSFLVALTAALVLFPAASAAQVYLYGRTDFPTGNNPAAVIIADFNADGRMDLAVSNFADSTISVLLGRPGGGFAPKVDYPTGDSPAGLVAADFNHDGNLDLAVANENAGTVSILLGNGDGTFQSHVDYPVGYAPVGIAAADFDGDGKIDLAVADFYDNSVAILLGDGHGVFQVQALVPVGTGPTAIASGDFNHDRKPDLITSNGAGTVSVLLGKGDGTFTRVDSQSNADSPALAVGDFNRDGKLDAVVSSQFSQQVLLLLGNGDGTFEAPATILNSIFPPVAFAFALAGDFNHDGNLDVALPGIVLLPGKGDGSFGQPIFSPAAIASFAAGDLNTGGQLDLVGPDPNLNTVDILLGNGEGVFGGISRVVMASSSYGPDAAVAADFNGDGKLDLAVAETGYPHGQVSVALGKGNGSFGTPITSPFIAQGVSNDNLMLRGDFNGDGKPDLALMDDYATGFEVLLGKGDGSFQPAVDTTLSYTVLSLAAGDFNGDGKTDLVITTNGNGSDPSINIYLSNGDGTFTPGAQYSSPYYEAVTVADVNGDGKLDLIATSSGTNLQVFLGNGDGTFQNPVSGPSALYSGGTAAADFNKDGKVDLAVGTYNGIAFLAGNGDGTFQNPVYSNTAFQFTGRMLAGDFSGNGKLGLITYPPGDTTLAGAVLMAGNGNGTFSAQIPYSPTGPWPVDLIAGDFNSDGVDDFGMPDQDLVSGAPVVSLYLSAPAPDLAPTSLNFGSVAVGKTSSPKKVKLTNSGNSKLRISSITASGDFLQKNNCGKILGVGKTCTIQVTFKPTTKGLRTGEVSITDNAAGHVQKIALRGTGK